MIDFNKKKFVFILIGSLIALIFILYFSPQVQRRKIQDYDLTVKNYTNMDLKNLVIKNTKGNAILTFNTLNKSENKYKLSKKNLIESTSYSIMYETLDNVYQKELISFHEKYKFQNIIVIITTSSKEEIEFRILKK